MYSKKITTVIISILVGCLLTLCCIFMLKNPNTSGNGESSGESSGNYHTSQESSTEAVSQGEISTSTESSLEPSDSSDTDDSSTVYEESDEPEPQNSVVHFLACPDNIIHPSVYYDAINRAAEKAGVTPDYSNLQNAAYDFTQIYEYVAPAIKKADLAYINVETMIGGTAGKISGYPCFNTPAAAGQNLIDMGFDVYNLAHNHMLDSYNDKYLINCNKFFTDLGQTTIGYYKNKADTDNIKVMEVNGIKIAFLAYTYSTNGISLPSNSQTYIPYFDEALIKKQVQIAKEQADIIIASCHWGNEDTYTPNSMQKKYAQLLIDLNVDVILGMHPHVIQPMKWADRPDGGKTLLVYSLGNFVSGMQDGFNMLGGTLNFDIVKTPENSVYIENVVFTPIVTHYEPGKKVYLYGDDTGYRNFKIYYLENYTDELASKHNVPIWDKTHRPTLAGTGVFNKANLVETVKKYIPSEFLPEYYR